MTAALDARSSKQDELNALMGMAKQAGEGTYLSSLLSQELVDWTWNQMREDGSCDVMDALRFAVTEQAKRAGELAAARQQNETLGEMIIALQQEINYFKGESERQASLASDRLKAIRGLEFDIERRDAMIAASEARIAGLKVKLFDMAESAGKL